MPTQPVVVAAADLDIGAELDARRRPGHRLAGQRGAAERDLAIPNEVIGRGLILPVIQNEPFLPMKLASKEAGAGLPPAIPPGLRAVSVRVNEVIGVAGYVLPGTRVDVVATVSPTQQPARHDVEGRFSPTCRCWRPAPRSSSDGEKDKPIAVSVVTLLVDPDEAERLTLARTEGKIQLALRNPLDKATPVTRGVGRRRCSAPRRPYARSSTRERRWRRMTPRRCRRRAGAVDRRNHPRRQTRARSRARAGVTQ